MNLALRLLASWFVVSIPFGILLGKALKVLATRLSGATVPDPPLATRSS